MRPAFGHQNAAVDLAGGEYNRTPLTVAKTSDVQVIRPGGLSRNTQYSHNFGAL